MGKNRVYLPADTAPGAEVTFSFTVSVPYGTPQTTTAVNFQWRMVQDGVEWFGATHNDAVAVSTGAATTGTSQTGPRDLYNARLEPANRTGAPGEDLLSGNFNWGLDTVNLAGRAGFNLSLPLSYNSLVWTRFSQKGNTVFAFDADRGFPSPGFRLGFPSIQGPFVNEQTQGDSYLMIMPSGARVELRQIGSSHVYESVNSSYLQLSDGNNGSLVVRTPDGSQLAYWSINSEYRCTEIKDRNGNYITIKYDPINGTENLGRMTSVIDTLGRTINFNYDENFRLQTITQMRNGLTHVWASFGYADLEIQARSLGDTEPEDPTGRVSQEPGSGPRVVGLPDNNTLSVLTKVGLDDGSSYTFEYTLGGQIHTIHRVAADGHELAYTSYNLAMDPDDAETDFQRFDQRVDWVENWNDNSPATTTFQSDPNGAWGQMTSAAGTSNQVSYREYSSRAYGDWFRGLVTSTEIRDHTNAVKKTTTTAWERDFTGVPYAVNPRPKRITISDSEGNRRQTSIEYTSFGLPAEVFEQGPLNTSDWTILRRTHTDYDLSPAYVNRHILGLVKGQYLFAPDALNSPSVQTLMSKTTYEYDVDTGICNGLCADYATAANSSAIVQHDSVNYGAGLVVGRGALTRARRWDVGDEWNESKRIITSMHYNSLGSAIRSSDPLGHQTTIGYADQFSVDGTSVANRSTVTMAYPTVTTDPDGYSASARYNYDLGTVTRMQDPKGAAQTTQYDSAGRVRQANNAVNGAYTRMVYPPSQTLLVSATTINDLSHEAFSFSVFDGAGHVRANASDFPDSTPHYSGRYTSYDLLGRAVSQSNPVEINGNWTAAGADASAQGGFGWVFSTQSFDWKGRPLITTNTDGTMKEASYGGCGCAGGEVVTLTDEGTIANGAAKRRQRKVYSDVLSRVWKTEFLNWEGGSVYATSVSTYNVRDQVTLARSYAGAEDAGTYQDKTAVFDGHGRLLSKHVPEQNAGTATTYSYNADDTISSVTDARGAVATYTYNNRHLVTGTSYSAPSGSGISVPGAASYAYDAAGNRASMSDGLGSRSYTYDQLSRMLSETRTFSGVGTLTLSYDYNYANELKKITDATGMTINYGYDAVGRLNSVTGSGTLYGGVSNYVSSFQYRAWGGLKAMTDGMGYITSLLYNAKLHPSHFQISGNIVNQDYDYYNDGSISVVHNTTDQAFDRSYAYDQVQRLTGAKSGADVNGYQYGAIPYRETFGYDAFSNLTVRESESWNGLTGDSDAANYTNGRRSGWGYDADGRNTAIGNRTNTFDAAGQQIGMNATVIQPNGSSYSATQADTYDGDATMAKEVTTKSNAPGYTNTTYYLRSSVLGGSIVEEIGSSGQKNVGYVYTPRGLLLATQQPNSPNMVTWKHRTPAGTSEYTVNTYNSVTGRTEFDSVGANVASSQPSLPPPDEGEGDIDSSHFGGIMDARWADFFNLSSGCVKSGISASCSQVMGAVNGNSGPEAGGGPLSFYIPGLGASGSVPIDLSPDFADWLAVKKKYYAPGAYDEVNLLSLDKEYTDELLNPERRLTKEDIGRIRAEVAAMLAQEKCRTFINRLLASAAAETGSTYSADILANFDTVAKEGGFHARLDLLGYTKSGDSFYAGGTTQGGPVGTGSARVNLNSKHIGGMNQGNKLIYVALAALHEVIHASGAKLNDSTLAIAVANMSGSKAPARATNLNEIIDRSGKWNDQLSDACLIWRSSYTGGKK